MQFACWRRYACPMSAIQVRDVPDDVVDVLKRRAECSGMSLTEYLRGELNRIARRPTIDELWDRIQEQGNSADSTSAVEILRSERDAR